MERRTGLVVILPSAVAAVLLIYGESLSTPSLHQTEDALGGGLREVCHVSSSSHTSWPELPQMPGWPKGMGAHPNYAPSGCVLADIDGDGDLEILAGSTDGSFHVWSYEGIELPGWPKAGLGVIQTEAAVGDMDGNGDPEILVPDRTGNLYAWNHDGTNVPGWPLSVGETGGLEAAVLFDLDGDGYLEVILGQRLWPNGRVQVFRASGTTFPGWPQSLDYMCVATPSVADVDGDSLYEICAVSYYSVYLWDQDGNPEPGWPVLNYYGGASYAQPVICDLDDDGDLEILVMYYTSGQDWVSVFRHDGTVFPGWPETYPGPQGYVCPVTADIDGDRDCEVFGGGHVFGGPDFSCRHHSGIQVTGWPVMVGMVECSPVIFDVDGDGDREIVVGSNTNPGQLYAFHENGSVVAGWPISMSGAAMVNSPAVGDVDLDGDIEIALVNGNGTVNLWTSDGVPYRGYYTDWGSYFHDLWNTGWFHPLAPAGLRASPLPSGPVLLDWSQNPEPDVAGYNVYRSEFGGGPYDRVSPGIIPDTVYLDTTVSPLSTYYYVVTCIIKAQAESRLSDEVSVTTGVEEAQEARCKMQEAGLLQSYPNPFSRSTTVTYQMPSAVSRRRTADDVSTYQPINLSLYDLSGRLVRTLIDKPFNYPTMELSNDVVWDGRDEKGRELPGGVYFLRLTSTGLARSAKVVLLR